MTVWVCAPVSERVSHVWKLFDVRTHVVPLRNTENTHVSVQVANSTCREAAAAALTVTRHTRQAARRWEERMTLEVGRERKSN